MRNAIKILVIVVMWTVTAIALRHGWCVAVVLAGLSTIITGWIVENLR